MYLTLKIVLINWPHTKFCVVRIPLKIKVFLWLAAHGSIVTKDVPIRRDWKSKDNKMLLMW